MKNMKQVIAILILLFSTSLYAQNTKITPRQIQQAGATSGQVLTWNGSLWVPGNVSGVDQVIDTFEIVSNILRLSLSNDMEPFKSVDLSSYLDNTDAQTLSIDSTTVGGIERFAISLTNSPSISFDVSNTVGTVTSVGITQPAAGITVSGSPITSSGNMTLALANDLAGLEGLSTTGLAARTGDGTWATRTLAFNVSSSSYLGVGTANLEGVAGNPTVTFNNNLATSKRFVQAVATTNLDLDGTETIDGISVTAGQRVLVVGQTLPRENGIYDVAAGAWTRSTDADASTKLDPGILVCVKLGSTYGMTYWKLDTKGPYTIGTTNLVFSQVFTPSTTDLTFTGASSPYTLNSSTGTDVTFTQGSGITITRSSNDLSFAAVDNSATNEIQQIDTFQLSGTELRLSLSQDNVPYKTVTFTGWDTDASDDITGSGATNQVAYFNGTQTVTGSNALVYETNTMSMYPTARDTNFVIRYSDEPSRMFGIVSIQDTFNSSATAYKIGALSRGARMYLTAEETYIQTPLLQVGSPGIHFKGTTGDMFFNTNGDFYTGTLTGSNGVANRNMHWYFKSGGINNEYSNPMVFQHVYEGNDTTGNTFEFLARNIASGGITHPDSTLMRIGNWDRGTALEIKHDGKIGLNTRTPTRKLDIDGEVRIRDLTTTSATLIVVADSDGVLSSATVGSGLSLTGGTLSATGGGGNGIYGGSGTIASNTVATITSGSAFTIDYNGGNDALSFSDAIGSFILRDKTTEQYVAADDLQIGIAAGSSSLVMYNDGVSEFNHSLRVYNGAFALSSTLTPTSITSDQNNYAPTNIGIASILRLTTDATRTITGISSTSPLSIGRILVVNNVGSHLIVLSNNNASSTDVNRFLFGEDIILRPDQSVTLVYDNDTERWRTASSPQQRPQVSTPTFTSNDYLLVRGDENRMLRLSNGSTTGTLTVPPNSSVAFPIGTTINMTQTGTGQITITPGSGVTINSADSKTKFRVQYSGASLTKTDTDTWLLVGDIAN